MIPACESGTYLWMSSSVLSLSLRGSLVSADFTALARYVIGKAFWEELQQERRQKLKGKADRQKNNRTVNFFGKSLKCGNLFLFKVSCDRPSVCGFRFWRIFQEQKRTHEVEPKPEYIREITNHLYVVLTHLIAARF